MAKIVDLKQGTGNVFPRTIGEAVAVGGKLLTEAISNLDEKVSAVSGLNDLISGESTGTVNVAPNASDIYIGNDGNPNQRVRIIGSESVYARSKHIISLGTDTCNIEISPQMGIIIGDRYDNNRNNINIGTSDNSIKIGHTYNSIQIGSDYSISIGTYNGIDINSYGKISIGAQLTNDVIIGTSYNNIKLGSDCSITIGTQEAIKIDSDGRVVFGPNSGFSGGGSGSGSNLDISSGTVMSIGAKVPTDIYIGTAGLNNLKQIAKDIKIQNDSYSEISMSTAQGINIQNAKLTRIYSPETIITSGKHKIKLGSDNNLTIGYNDAIKIRNDNIITIGDYNNTSGLVLGAQDTKIVSKELKIYNDIDAPNTSYISMSTLSPLCMYHLNQIIMDSPRVDIGFGVATVSGIVNIGTSDVSNVNIKGTTAKIEANSIEINSIESFMVDDFKIITDSTTDTITFLNTLTGRSITLKLTDQTTTDTTGTTGSTGLTSGTSEMTSGTTPDTSSMISSATTSGTTLTSSITSETTNTTSL